MEEQARKDLVRIGEAAVGDDNSDAGVYIQFQDWIGDYPVYCHPG